MSKFAKSLLVGTISLGLLAPVATSFTNPIQTTINAKRRRTKHIRRNRSHWTRSAPKAIRGYWMSKRSHHKVFGLTFLSSGVAFNPSGAAISNWTAPVFKSDGHNTYSIRTSRHSHNQAFPHISGESYYIKKHGKKLSVWTNGKYIGKYTRSSRKALFD